MDNFNLEYEEENNLSLDTEVLHEIMKKANGNFSQVGMQRQMAFLYFNDDLLLEAAPSKLIMQAVSDPHLPAQNKYELTALITGFNGIVKHCNKEIKDLKRIRIEPCGLHVPNDQTLPVTKDLDELKLKSLPKKIQEKIILKSLTKEDIIKPQKGENLDWLSFMIPDGKVYPYTILPTNVLSKYGFPIGLYTKGDEDVNPKSIKHVYYIDPETMVLSKGVYFEVYEGSGPKGPGGINGVIVPANKPLVIINNRRQEAYFVNIDEGKKETEMKGFTDKGLMISG